MQFVKLFNTVRISFWILEPARLLDFCSPLEVWDRQLSQRLPLPLHPYRLGQWLGGNLHCTLAGLTLAIISIMQNMKGSNTTNAIQVFPNVCLSPVLCIRYRISLNFYVSASRGLQDFSKPLWSEELML